MRARRKILILLLVGCLGGGCATTVAPDTKLSWQGPRAKVSKSF